MQCERALQQQGTSEDGRSAWPERRAALQAPRPSDSGWRSHGSFMYGKESPSHFSDRKKGGTTDNRPSPLWSAHDPAAELSGCCTWSGM